MSKAKAINLSAAEKALGVELFKNRKASQALHEAVTAYRANRRAGTHATLTKATVDLSGTKPWRQKGTGRARAGYKSSPVWRGGGVVFGPKPRDFTKKVNKKVRAVALRKALSERLKAGDVVVVDDFKLETHKTKEFLGLLGSLKLDARTILLVSGENKNLQLGSRNVPNVTLTSGERLNTYEALLCDKLVFTKAALEKVALRLSNK